MKCSWNTNIFDDSLLTDMIDSIDQKEKKPDKGFFNIQNQAAISHAIYKQFVVVALTNAGF